MRLPLEITYRNVPKSDKLERLVFRNAQKLDRFCDHVMACRIAIEKPHEHQKSGNAYRVRIDLTVPPGHELVVKREPGEGSLHDDLSTVVRNAFAAAQRQLKKLVEQQRGHIKRHPENELGAVVVRLFRRKGYGFLKTPEGREIYFHRNSVLNNDFTRLTVGTGVRFVEEQGEKGIQATTVQIVDKPGVGGSDTAP
jgi:cold shock CspA family protein